LEPLEVTRAWCRLQAPTTYRSLYILDFFCHKAQLAIEVDGGLHDAQKDAMRDEYFASLGIETYRVSAADVYRNADTVADGIKLKLRDMIGK
jgi:very-short-patch-repair endonuclease